MTDNGLVGASGRAKGSLVPKPGERWATRAAGFSLSGSRLPWVRMGLGVGMGRDVGRVRRAAFLVSMCINYIFFYIPARHKCFEIFSYV